MRICECWSTAGASRQPLVQVSSNRYSQFVWKPWQRRAGLVLRSWYRLARLLTHSRHAEVCAMTLQRSFCHDPGTTKLNSRLCTHRHSSTHVKESTINTLDGQQQRNLASHVWSLLWASIEDAALDASALVRRTPLHISLQCIHSTFNCTIGTNC